jgi:hypothetical protein
LYQIPYDRSRECTKIDSVTDLLQKLACKLFGANFGQFQLGQDNVQVSIFDCVGGLNGVVNEVVITLDKRLQVLGKICMIDVNGVVQ